MPSHLTLTLDQVLPGRGVYQLRLDPAGLTVDPLRVFLPVRLRPECGDAGDCVRRHRAARAAHPARLRHAGPGLHRAAGDADGPAAVHRPCGRHVDRRPDGDAGRAVRPPRGPAALPARPHRHRGLAVDRTAPRQRGQARPRRSTSRSSRRSARPRPSRWWWPPPRAATRRRRCSPAIPRPMARRSTPPRPASPSRRRGPLIVRSSHAEVALYDWTEDDAVLGAGATSAILVRPAAAAGVAVTDWLPAGSLLAFEVVGVDDIGRQRAWVAGTVPAPADVMPRPPLASRPAQVVTVTSVAEFTDPLQPGVDLLRVFWDASEALQAPVPCSVDQSAGRRGRRRPARPAARTPRAARGRPRHHRADRPADQPGRRPADHRGQ